MTSDSERVRGRPVRGHPYPARDPKDESKRLVDGSPSGLASSTTISSPAAHCRQPLRALFAGGGTGDAVIMLAQQLTDAGAPAEILYLDI